MAAQALASAGFFVSVPIFPAPAFDLVTKWGRAIRAIQVKSGALHDNQKVDPVDDTHPFGLLHRGGLQLLCLGADPAR